ncbi:hypothetical protein BJV82DRAFT_614257 [Fennellomyces sp. T-0311]|nr:hypothetical protein BJV82DRAFT_614257 [Fennellomyces sp. T-0311]
MSSGADTREDEQLGRLDVALYIIFFFFLPSFLRSCDYALSITLFFRVCIFFSILLLP